VDIIKSGGYKISALEIEEVLRKHPKIKDCGVVGIPNLEWGEIIGAAIVPETDNFDIEELKSWLHKKLPGYKTPRKYMFMSDLPRNVMGKVTKNNIKELFTTNQ
jgi:malonyl-CoA/methylmalonyl-CoA synthetase